MFHQNKFSIYDLYIYFLLKNDKANERMGPRVKRRPTGALPAFRVEIDALYKGPGNTAVGTPSSVEGSSYETAQ